MARQKNNIDTNEVDEIIRLKLEDLGGLKSKLTYNNVFNFNKELVKTGAINYKGESFNLYGYTFWCSGYNGEDYYGKAKIDEIKTSNNVVLAGESFEKDVQDILAIVDKYKNKPQELSKRMVKVFEQDRKKISSLTEQNKNLSAQLDEAKDRQSKFEQGFVTMFYNSIYTDNSLTDVMSIKKDGDSHMRDELVNMFNGEDKVSQILAPKKIEQRNSAVVSINKKLENKKKLNDLF